MKEVEDAARERVTKETEVKELKAREDRLGKEIKFKDSVSVWVCQDETAGPGLTYVRVWSGSVARTCRSSKRRRIRSEM